MAYYVKYTNAADGYVFKVEDNGGRGVRMLADKWGTRFEFFTFGSVQLANIETGLTDGAMCKVDEIEYLTTLRSFLKWNVETINKLDKIL